MFPETDLPGSLRYKVTPVSCLKDAIARGRLWVALCEDSPVGFAVASVVDGAAYLDELGVIPEFTRRGIGTMLVSAVIDWATIEKYSCLALITFSHLPWNAPFYEKIGFHKMDIKEHGREMACLIKEEGRIGLDVTRRVAMYRDL